MTELDKLVEVIKPFEGLRLVPYFCPAGVLTVGWGSTGKGVVLGKAWTLEQAQKRLEEEAATCLAEAKKLVPTLYGGALVAVADFVYNLGAGRLKASTLRKRLLAGDKAGAIRELGKWTRGGGRVLPGLVKRRAVEAALLSNSAWPEAGRW